MYNTKHKHRPTSTHYSSMNAGDYSNLCCTSIGVYSDICTQVTSSGEVNMWELIYHLFSFPDPSPNQHSPSPPDQGPVFLAEPPSKLSFANTGGAWVPCTAYGRPAPALEWVTEEDVVVEDVAGLLRVLPNNTLHLLPFSADHYRPDVHAAQLRCRASNSAGTILSRMLHLNAGQPLPWPLNPFLLLIFNLSFSAPLLALHLLLIFPLQLPYGVVHLIPLCWTHLHSQLTAVTHWLRSRLNSGSAASNCCFDGSGLWGQDPSTMATAQVHCAEYFVGGPILLETILH